MSPLSALLQCNVFVSNEEGESVASCRCCGEEADAYALPRKCLLSVAVADYVSTLYVCCCVAGLDSSCSSAIGVLESARFGYSCCGGRNVLTACE